METALHIQTKVLPGNRIEIESSKLAVGEEVEVIIVINKAKTKEQSSVIDAIEKIRQNRSSFKTAKEIQQQIQQERESWDI